MPVGNLILELFVFMFAAAKFLSNLESVSWVLKLCAGAVIFFGLLGLLQTVTFPLAMLELSAPPVPSNLCT